jgi:hypothetical protein
MQQEDEVEEERHPRDIQERNRTAAGEKGAYRVGIPHRLLRARPRRTFKRQIDDYGVHGACDALVKQHGGLTGCLIPQQIENPIEGVHNEHKNGECQEITKAARMAPRNPSIAAERA